MTSQIWLKPSAPTPVLPGWLAATLAATVQDHQHPHKNRIHEDYHGRQTQQILQPALHRYHPRRPFAQLPAHATLAQLSRINGINRSGGETVPVFNGNKERVSVYDLHGFDHMTAPVHAPPHSDMDQENFKLSTVFGLRRADVNEINGRVRERFVLFS